MAIRFVAFDLGNVLCDLVPEAFGRALAQACGRTLQQVQDAFDDHAHRLMERGDAPPSHFRAAFLRALDARLDDATFDACWNLLPVPRAGADALVARVTVPYAIWSNTDPIHVPHLEGRLACLGRARHRLYSYAARTRKPEVEYFRAGLAALDADPADVLFIDDRAENREAARGMGLVVEEALVLADVEAALRRHGVLGE